MTPFLWRSVIGTYHVRPLPYLLGNAPTIGQALYIATFVILNVVLSAVNYKHSQPHPWYFPPKEELLSYIGYRTGHISYALLPLVILLSGRNNVLLWLTNWSHGTYIFLHRWVARVFTVHAIVHSITLLICYQGTGSYAVDSKKSWWLWGIVATVLACAMVVFSHLYFRRLSYEIFIVGHIVMAVLLIVGCWYHIVPKWGYNFYLDWLMAASAIWFLDRLLRVVRMAKNGFRRSVVTELDAEHVRVDIPGLRFPNKPGYVGHVYFPGLTPLRPWENHPFSVNSTALFHNPPRALGTASDSTSLDLEKNGQKDISTVVAHPQDSPSVSATEERAAVAQAFPGTDGITLIIKKNKGLTRLLTTQASITALIEGPYSYHPSSEVMSCDRILLIGGGIGITGLLAWVHTHPNVKLAWSVKSSAEALVREVQPALCRMRAADQHVRIGERLDIDALLAEEAEAGWKRIGIVVCGPGGMCDAVRAKVSDLGRKRSATKFELEIEAFSW